MVELKQTELGQTRDQILQFVVKGAHGFSNRVFLLKNFFPHTVKSRVVNFEQIFDVFLLLSHFSHKSWFFDLVIVFQVCNALLDFLRYFAQDDVLLSLVLWQALYAVEIPADPVAKLDFILGVRGTEELFRVKIESSDSIRSLNGSCWLEFREGSGWSCVEVSVLLIISVNLRFAILVNF